MSAATKFLQLYNQLDAEMRKRLRADARVSHADLIEHMARVDPVFRNNASRLHAYRALRNSLVHLSVDGATEPIAEPRADIVDHYARLVGYAVRPPSALETIAVRDVFTVDWDSPLLPTLCYMLVRSYRVAPIVRYGMLEGVFTETAIAEQVAASGQITLDETTTFSAFRAVASFDQPVRGVRVLHEATTIPDIEATFADAFRRGVALSVVLLTPEGRTGGALSGLVTAHDLPSASGAPVI